MPLALLSTGASTVDLTATTQSAITLVTAVLGLFEVYPLNLILTFALASYAFRFFGRGRKAAGGGI